VLRPAIRHSTPTLTPRQQRYLLHFALLKQHIVSPYCFPGRRPGELWRAVRAVVADLGYVLLGQGSLNAGTKCAQLLPVEL